MTDLFKGFGYLSLGSEVRQGIEYFVDVLVSRPKFSRVRKASDLSCWLPIYRANLVRSIADCDAGDFAAERRVKPKAVDEHAIIEKDPDPVFL